MSSTPSKSRKTIIGISAIIIVLIFLFVPIIPVTYTDKEPYQVTETKTEGLTSINDYTLEPNYFVHQSAYIPSGRDVEYSVRASDTVDTYVFTSSEFANYKAGRSAVSVAERKNAAETRYGFHTSIADTYYFVVYNGHTGLFGIGAKKVGIYSATSKATWQETVTKYREVTKTKYMSLIELLLRGGKA